jgi:hypothetical protein
MKTYLSALLKAISLGSMLFLSSCSSYREFHYITQELEIPSKIFASDFNQTWQAVLKVMKSYALSVKDIESGVIKTRWIDNTLEVNFSDSFGNSDAVKAAKYKLVINVVKGFRGKREVSKVTVFKRQMVEQDFLQGWKVVQADGIKEKSILYRVERLIKIESKLKKIEDLKSKEAESNF